MKTMLKKLDISHDCRYLLLIKDYYNDLNEWYKKRFGEEYKKGDITYIIRDNFEEIEEFNIAWMDGYDWSKISKSSNVGKLLLEHFPTLELGE